MAKEQNLSLNPTKISGVCGRLMCCLKNEEETYEELNRRLPNIGDSVTTDDGFKGEVHSVNVLRQLVKVIVDVEDEKEIREYEVDRLRFKRKHGRKEKMELSKEELQELERLEQEEQQDKQLEEQQTRQQEQDRKQEPRQDRQQERRKERQQEANQEKEKPQRRHHNGSQGKGGRQRDRQEGKSRREEH